jgi:hypothetical protein
MSTVWLDIQGKRTFLHFYSRCFMCVVKRMPLCHIFPTIKGKDGVRCSVFLSGEFIPNLKQKSSTP